MTRVRPAVLLSLLCVVGAAVALAACGKRENTATAPTATTKLSLVLDYQPNADHAGVYAGIGDGEFAKAGLSVTPQVPPDASSPLKLLLAGRADLAISYEPELLLARDKGANLVSVAALIQKPLTSIISVDKKFKTPADLQGQTVGTAGIPYQTQYLKTIAKAAGVTSYKEVDVGFNLVPAMLSKNVDATLGGFWNVEGVQLQRAKKNPTIIPVDQAGVPTYDELVLVARADYLATHGAVVRRFVQALGRATNDVKANPSVGLDPLLAADPSLDKADQAASLDATLKAGVFFNADPKKPFGWQSVTEWGKFAAWMYAHGLLTRPQTSRALSNEFLPGQGL